MVHREHQPNCKPAPCFGPAHDGLVDDTAISYRHSVTNLLTQMGYGAAAIFAGAGPAHLFLCAENNAPGISIRPEGFASFQPDPDRKRACYSCRTIVATADIHFDHHLPVLRS